MDPDKIQNGTSDLSLHCLLRPVFTNTNCALDIFQKVVFCLVFYTEEVNLQIFVMQNHLF